jgi:hypothetical protein
MRVSLPVLFVAGRARVKPAVAQVDRAPPGALFCAVSPQRHADDGRHPRQATASTIWLVADSGLLRNDAGERFAVTGPRASSRARVCGRGRPRSSLARSTAPHSRGGRSPNPGSSFEVNGPRPRIAFGVRGGGEEASPARREPSAGPRASSRAVLRRLSAASCRRRSASTAGNRFNPAACRGFRPSPE